VTEAAHNLSVFDAFDATGYRPHREQERIHRSPARFRVVSAGRRFGKSKLGGNELTPDAFAAYAQRNYLRAEEQRREYWIVGPEYSDSEKEFRVVWGNLKKLGVPLDKPGSYYNPTNGDLHLSAWDGVFQVHGKSARHPETLVGEGLSGVIMAEAAKLKPSVWTKFIRPTLADFKGWAFFSSTPEGKNWFYRAWQDGQNPLYKEWASFRCPAWMNPYVYPGETSTRDIARAQRILADRGRRSADSMRQVRQLAIDPEILSMLLDLTPESFAQEVGAEFNDFVGRVFKDFDEEIHVGDLAFNPRWQTFAAVDYGFTNPTVWLLLQVGPFGDINVIGEYYESGRTAREAANEIQARGLAPASTIAFYPDPALPGETKELSETLKIAARGGTGGELRDRIDAIRKALKIRPEDAVDEAHRERPQLMIDRRCVDTIREFNEYRYPKTATEAANVNLPEAPLKKDDHTPEALGRFFAGHYGPKSSTRRRGTRVRTATMTG
jgi:hypothetical protein